MNLSPILFSKTIGTLFILFAIIFISSCDKNESIYMPDDRMPTDFSYKVAIHVPGMSPIYRLGDTLFLDIDFSSETNEIVHNIKVEILNINNAKKLYSAQSHVHVDSLYHFTDFLILDDTLSIQNQMDWYCKGSMWSHQVNAEIAIDSSLLKII